MVTVELQLQKSCLEFLDEHTSLVSVKRGTRLVPHGSALDYWMLVADGLLVSEALVHSSEYRPVALWAETSAISPTSYPGQPRFGLYAVTDSSILVLRKSRFDEAFSRWTDFAFAMFEAGIARNSELQVMHSRISGLPTHLQIANLLWSLIPYHHLDAEGGKPLKLKISQQLLGDFFGVTREEINKKFKLLTSEGLIHKTDYGHYLTQSVRQVLVEYGGTTEPPMFNAAIVDRMYKAHQNLSVKFDPFVHNLGPASAPE